MKGNNHNLLVLILQNDQAKWIPASRQTQNIRKSTNLKIRELGDKYFQVKNLFEQKKFHRDRIFAYGKYIEEKYSKIKKVDRIKYQYKRMKDALYCWFAENFYLEIMEPNSKFLQQMEEFCNNECQDNDKPMQTQQIAETEKENNIEDNNNNILPFKRQIILPSTSFLSELNFDGNVSIFEPSKMLKINLENDFQI